MSTSTITSLLSHLYYMIANFKSPHFSGLSKAYDNEPLKFMISQRKPNTVFLRQQRTEDKRQLEPSNTVLLKMGKYMEKMFTTDAEFFNDYFVLDLKTNKPRVELTEEMINDLRDEDYFRYMMVGKMFLRSQIDCRGEDENGNPIVFELKTRATAPLRYDISNYIDFLDYSIIKCKGRHSSFEREFYDLVRGGFLKYIMQMKIGRMQGAAIAYHNTQKVFGFEYIKLEEMENESSDAHNSVMWSLTNHWACSRKFSTKSLKISTCRRKQRKTTRKVTKCSAWVSTLMIPAHPGSDGGDFRGRRAVLARYKDQFRPDYMKDPVDFYLVNKIKPKVIRYQVGIYPVLNGVFIDYSPILFETGDHLDIKYTIQRQGPVDFNTYMRFLHEAYKSEKLNLDNDYA
eukprot:CAMPEP_0170478460 /NCGR_PEP_ID=MMETSP0123-20130129/19470_1 /TAXON_ID=182087 /ORGANISM="Favella ehrenbergii, Strain Fehren 1" /LENGTH=399 /DNA_ID=CAMNT_0010750711 /DNA_START=255 /DNA_END=1453 /DNA_ORIENTATION=-